MFVSYIPLALKPAFHGGIEKMRFRLFVALFVLFCAATVSAQDLNFNVPTPTRDIIQAAAEGAKIQVEGLNQIPTTVMFQGEYDFTDRRRAINYVLTNSSDSGWEAIGVDGRIVIRRRGASGSDNTQPASPSSAPPSGFPPSATQAPSGCPAAADTDPTATPNSPDPAKRAEYWRAAGYECLRWQEVGRWHDAANQAQLRRMQMESWNGSYSGGTYQNVGYGYQQEYFNPFGLRDFNNAEKYGLLKIDGPDRFLRQVRVVIDGRDMAVASKANNAWNKPVLLTAGPHVVEFVHEGPRGIVAFRREVEIASIAVQRMAFGKNEPVWLRVSGNEFANARELYQYKQHVFIEK